MSGGEGKVFLVGGDGLIGSALQTALEVLGQSVITTTRRPDPGGRMVLDLAAVPEGWHPPKGVKAAVICAGISRLEACRQDPVGSRAVNVDGTLKVIQALIRQGVFVVFLSTNHVFDGTVPVRHAEDALCPVTEYGRQKAAVETVLHAHPDASAVVRLTKVVGLRDPLLMSWAADWSAGRTVTPFADMHLAPVPLACVTAALGKILECRRGGVWQISGAEDWSYEAAARLGARRLGVPSSLIRPILAQESGRFHECPPRHTALDTTRLRRDLGLAVPAVQKTLEDIFDQFLKEKGRQTHVV